MDGLAAKLAPYMEQVLLQQPIDAIQFAGLDSGTQLFYYRLLHLLERQHPYCRSLISQLEQIRVFGAKDKLPHSAVKLYEQIKVILTGEVDPDSELFKSVMKDLQLNVAPTTVDAEDVTTESDQERPKDTKPREAPPMTSQMLSKLLNQTWDVKERYDLMLKHKQFAVENREAQRDPELYYSVLGKKGLQIHTVPDGIIARYFDTITKSKMLADRLLTQKRLLVLVQAYPGNRAIKKALLKELRDIQSLYDNQEKTAFSNQELYDQSIRFLISKELVFDISRDTHYIKYYCLLKEYLTPGDFDAIVKANKQLISDLTSGSQCPCLALMYHIAHDKGYLEKLPSWALNIGALYIDTSHVNSGRLVVASDKNLDRYEIYYGIADDVESYNQYEPNVAGTFACGRADGILRFIEHQIEVKSKQSFTAFIYEADGSIYQFKHDYLGSRKFKQQYVVQELTADEATIRLLNYDGHSVEAILDDKHKLLVQSENLVHIDFKKMAKGHESTVLIRSVAVADKFFTFKYPHITLEANPCIQQSPDLSQLFINGYGGVLQIQFDGITRKIQLFDDQISLGRLKVCVSTSDRQQRVLQFAASKEVDISGCFGGGIAASNVVSVKVEGKLQYGPFEKSFSKEFNYEGYRGNKLVQLYCRRYADAELLQFYVQDRPLASIPVVVDGKNYSTDEHGIVQHKMDNDADGPLEVQVHAFGADFRYNVKVCKLQWQTDHSRGELVFNVYSNTRQVQFLSKYSLEKLFLGEEQLELVKLAHYCYQFTIADGETWRQRVMPLSVQFGSARFTVCRLRYVNYKRDGAEIVHVALPQKLDDTHYIIPAGSQVHVYGSNTFGEVTMVDELTTFWDVGEPVEQLTQEYAPPRRIQQNPEYVYLLGLGDAFKEPYRLLACKKPGLALKERKLHNMVYNGRQCKSTTQAQMCKAEMACKGFSKDGNMLYGAGRRLKMAACAMAAPNGRMSYIPGRCHGGPQYLDRGDACMDDCEYEPMEESIGSVAENVYKQIRKKCLQVMVASNNAYNPFAGQCQRVKHNVQETNQFYSIIEVLPAKCAWSQVNVVIQAADYQQRYVVPQALDRDSFTQRIQQKRAPDAPKQEEYVYKFKKEVESAATTINTEEFLDKHGVDLAAFSKDVWEVLSSGDQEFVFCYLLYAKLTDVKRFNMLVPLVYSELDTDTPEMCYLLGNKDAMEKFHDRFCNMSDLQQYLLVRAAGRCDVFRAAFARLHKDDYYADLLNGRLTKIPSGKMALLLLYAELGVVWASTEPQATVQFNVECEFVTDSGEFEQPVRGQLNMVVVKGVKNMESMEGQQIVVALQTGSNCYAVNTCTCSIKSNRTVYESLGHIWVGDDETVELTMHIYSAGQRLLHTAPYRFGTTQTAQQTALQEFRGLLASGVTEPARICEYMPRLEHREFAQAASELLGGEELARLLDYQVGELGDANMYLVAGQHGTGRHRGLLREMVLSAAGNESMTHRKQPCHEVHPYVASRVLRRGAPGAQYNRQLLHTLVQGDYENLFCQSVLAERFQVAASCLERAGAAMEATRYAAFLAYYRQTWGPQQAHSFNTFTSESAARYGTGVVAGGDPIEVRFDAATGAATVQNRAGLYLEVSQGASAVLRGGTPLAAGRDPVLACRPGAGGVLTVRCRGRLRRYTVPSAAPRYAVVAMRAPGRWRLLDAGGRPAAMHGIVLRGQAGELLWTGRADALGLFAARGAALVEVWEAGGRACELRLGGE